MKWQPIKTAPKDGSSFIMWPQDEEHQTAHWSGRGFRINCCGQHAEITHWMPLPEPPDAAD